MRVKEFKIVVAALGVAAFTLQSCGKYEDGPALSLKSKKGRLTGEWELTNSKEVFGENIEYIFEFQKDGDLKVSFSYSYYGYSGTRNLKGDWEWADGKSAIEIDIDGSYEEWDILKLTNTELTLDYDGEALEFEKQ